MHRSLMQYVRDYDQLLPVLQLCIQLPNDGRTFTERHILLYNMYNSNKLLSSVPTLSNLRIDRLLTFSL